MKVNRVLSILLAFVFVLSLTQRISASTPQSAEQTVDNAAVSIVSYGVRAIENFMGKDRADVYIDFKNNTNDNIQLICFRFDGYSKDGTKILSSQNNTNDLGKAVPSKGIVSVQLKFPVNLTTLQLEIEKYVTTDGEEHLLSDGNQNTLDFDFLIEGVENTPQSQATVNVASPNSIAITQYGSFLIGGVTPAIKVTLLNNTRTTVSDVQARIKMSSSEFIYTATQEIESDKEATHSGWGLVNGVKSIEIAISSYTTVDGEKYVVPKDKMIWMHIDL